MTWQRITLRKFQTLDLNPGRLAFHCFTVLPLNEHGMFGEPMKKSVWLGPVDYVCEELLSSWRQSWVRS